ncbi:MAG: antibiotic biosynthesis monooxygenase family protein [Leptospirales bacterium]
MKPIIDSFPEWPVGDIRQHVVDRISRKQGSSSFSRISPGFSPPVSSSSTDTLTGSSIHQRHAGLSLSGRQTKGRWQMVVVANRIRVAPGHEKDFEERFKNRRGLVDKNPGFIRNMILRPVDSEYYSVMTFWKTMDDFVAWTKSDSFKEAHSGPRPPKEMFSGPNVLEIHETVFDTEDTEEKNR